MVISDKNKVLSKEIGDLFLKLFIDDTSHMAQTCPKGKIDPNHPENNRDATWRAVKRGKNPEFFTEKDFLYHFFGDNPFTLKGAYFIDPDGNCKRTVIDIDGGKNRGKEDDLEKDVDANDGLTAVLDVFDTLGYRPLVDQSKSGSGYHVNTLFGKFPAPRARRFTRAVCRVAGLPDKTEVFPKQDSKEGDGSQVALPGGHWWNDNRNKRYTCAAWFIDLESWRPVPFEEWPAILRGADIFEEEERLAAAEKKLEEMGQARNGKSPFDPVTSDVPTSNGTGERRKREPRSDVMPDDPAYEGWLPSDMEDFLQEHGFGYEKKPHKDGSKYILNRCPWNTSHTDPEDNTGVATFIEGSGVLGFKCHHAHCEGKRWADFRQAVDPSWKRRQRECKGAKLTNIYSSSKLRAEAKKAKRAAEAEERKKRRDTIIAEAEAKKAALRDAVAGDAAAPGVGPSLAVGLGVSVATRVKIAESTERMREPGEDEDVALEEALAEAEAEKLKEEAEKLKAKAEKLRQVRIEHRKKYVLSRAWREHIVATSWREKYGLYTPVPRMGEVDPESGGPLRPDDMTEEAGEKVEKLNRAHQHTRNCRAITKVMLGKSGKKKVVPNSCDRSGCCVDCAEESARDQAEWADEHWDHEMVTLVEARNDESDPHDHGDIEALRKAASNVVKLAEKGPKKPRKKRKKKGESILGTEADAALGATAEPAVEPAAPKEKFPWRYVDGFRRSVIIGAAEMHEVIGARFQPSGPKSATGYAGDVVKCSESYALNQVTSRLVTKAEAIRILFGHEVGEDGKTDPTKFADWKSVWMEPSVELLARDRAGEKHLRTSCPGDPIGEAKWEAELDRLTLRCFAHPYVRVKKKKRTSGNAPGRVAFSLPTPAELRAWKKERRVRENPDLAQEPDEEYKVVELRYRGKLISQVHDHENKEHWQCAGEYAEALNVLLSMLGNPTYDPDEANRRQAAFVPLSDEESYRTGRVRTRPAYGCVPPSPRAALASAG